MKNITCILCLFVSFSVSAQVVSGLFSGRLVNDSTKKMQTYELALSQYRNKITGYSYTTFVRNDTFYYSIKSIKATRKENKLVVEDDEMILNNFPEPPAKHVHQINYIEMNPQEDTLREAKGNWETTKTKIYYSIHGGVAMKRDNDSTHSALIGHLKELGILESNDRHYYDASKDVAQNKKKEKENIVLKEAKEKDKTTSSGSKTSVYTKVDVAATAKTPSVLPYDQRKNHLMQQLNVSADSLILSFYDNGVVDGDSISVFLNGRNVISHSKLTASAMKKTISINGIGDEITLLVVADNLGTIPPNTGLVVVRDGDNVYQVNFTADMQTNATIVFRKQKK
jgi:hypothetical protein